MKKKVIIREVSPRDGLQIEETISSTNKIHFIEKLTAAGLKHIEVTSFSNPTRIPQFADAEIVVKRLKAKEGVYYYSLVPNLSAKLRAVDNVKAISLIVTAEEEFNLKNLNLSIDESMNGIKKIVALAKEKEIFCSGYIAMSFKTSVLQEVKRLVDFYLNQSVEEICFADTEGIAGKQEVAFLIEEIRKITDLKNVSMHFHNGKNQGMDNVQMALSMGVNKFDSSCVGLGGCPFLPIAFGNVSTEELVEFCNNNNIETGIDLSKLREASTFIMEKLQIE